MKYMSRSGVYKASNVTFNTETRFAHSYDWWVFVRPIKGQLVLNMGYYSNSTRKHQWKVRELLNELGLVFRTVDIGRQSLYSINSLAELNKAIKEQAKAQAAEEEHKRLARNEKARQRRAAVKAAQRPQLSVVS